MTATGGGRPDGLSACGRIVRENDPDRFFCALFAPSAKREPLFALYAFNHELARAREAVSEPALGEIRLRWWREALDGAEAGTPRRHEVVEALAETWSLFDRSLLDAMIDARAADMAPEPPVTLDDMADRGARSAGGLMLQAARLLGEEGDRIETVCAEAGRATALGGMLRSTDAWAARGRVALPTELLEPLRLDPRDILRREHNDRISKVVRAVVERAESHLKRARSARRDAPRRILSAMLPLAFAARDLATLRRNGCNPFDPAFLRGDGRQLFVLCRALLGRY